MWWIARPQPEADALVERLNQLGIAAQATPAVEIQPLEIDHRVIMELDQFDTLIVVSKPAARRLIDEIDQYWPQLPLGIDCIAVGPGTAQILQDYGFSPRMPEQADSEGVLALTQSAKRVLLAAGEGGRELIEQSLAACELTRLSLYHRVKGPVPAESVEAESVNLWVTSAEIAQAVAEWPHPIAEVWVPSTRVAEAARAVGLPVAQVLGSASDDSFIDAVLKDRV